MENVLPHMLNLADQLREYLLLFECVVANEFVEDKIDSKGNCVDYHENNRLFH